MKRINFMGLVDGIKILEWAKSYQVVNQEHPSCYNYVVILGPYVQQFFSYMSRNVFDTSKCMLDSRK